MKKYISLLIAGLIGATLVTTSSAAVQAVGDPGLSWAPPNDVALGEHIQEFLDTFPGENPSHLVRNDVPTATSSSRDYIEDPTCLSATDPRCVGKELQFQAVIPYCQAEIDTNCVVDFGVINSSGVRTSAKFSRYFPYKAQNQYLGNNSLQLPSGYAGSIFEIPSAPHDGGTSYYVAATLQGGGSSTSGFGKNPWSFAARVYPVQLQPDQGSGMDPNNLVDAGYSLNNRGRSDGSKYWGTAAPGFNGHQFCVANAVHEGLCAARFAFPADLRFYLKVRLQQNLAGWMHGRIANPEISVNKVGTNSELEVIADPVAVPVVYKMYNYQDMPAELKSKYDVTTGNYLSPSVSGEPGGRSGPSTDPLKRNVIIESEASSPIGMEQLKLWLPYVNDQAAALLSYWSVRSLGSWEMNGANRCFSDNSNITGIVTTNSTQYSAGPPAFEANSGVLNYKVASPHFTTKHEVFKGTYDLIMRSDVARCVYGFSNAPVKADISVTSADGSAQVVSTTLNESNGWLHLSANGFEFSAPQVNVKLTQDVPVAKPTETQSTQAPVASKSTVKQSTITCVKGKVSKKVTAVKPVCPTGYKKK